VGATITNPDCSVLWIEGAEVQTTSWGSWTSPHTQCTYPIGWDVWVAGEHFEVHPTVEDQEMYSTRPIYWEGSSTVRGDMTGRAYVELTGYCGSFLPWP
jgi:predicted secreted hydrolase